MDGQGLQALQKRRFRPQTTQSRHTEPIAPNRFKELPQAPQRPNEVWAADITSVPTQEEGWLYLAGDFEGIDIGVGPDHRLIQTSSKLNFAGQTKWLPRCNEQPTKRQRGWVPVDLQCQLLELG
jgi:transposase InsO family protein